MNKLFRFKNVWGAILLVVVLVISACGLFTEVSQPTEAVTELGVQPPPLMRCSQSLPRS